MPKELVHCVASTPYPMARRATATISCKGKEDTAPLQTSGEVERGSSTSTYAAPDGRCWGRWLGASVVVSDGEGRRSARVTCPGRRGRSTMPPPRLRCAPWPVPPRPHVASPEHRCCRARVPPRLSTRRRKRLGRTSWWRKKEDVEGPWVKRRKRKEEERKTKGRGKKKKKKVRGKREK
jgi:hypothetical protein